MAQSGYTPISFYYSTTAAATPTSGNLVNGEIAINTADGIIFYKNASGTVVPLSFGSAAVSWQSVQASSFTAAAGKGYPVNTTSAGVTATLPASPTAGQAVGFVDYAGTFATNNLTINPNGSKILGSTGNVIVTTNRESLLFVYVDSTKGWLPYAGFLGSNPAPATYTASYLVVAGGGAINDNFGGGGGAGGLLTNTATFTPGTVYTATVGAGGSNSNGNNSVLSGTGLTTVTAIGGGQGGNGGGSYSNAGSGGSGGGAGGFTSSFNNSIGSGTSGQGNNGGNNSRTNPYGAGGGGGAGAVGQDAASNSNNGGNGGIGVQSSITGSAVYYAGGGGGGCNGSLGSGGSGGTGGGGTGGGSQNGGTGTNGTANTGGGGGANPPTGGGSGVVILSVPTANYSGTTTGSPTVTTSGSNTIIKFTASGSYTA